jgi:hypothetical protein
MTSFHRLYRDPVEDERRRERLEDDRDEEARLHDVLDRAAEQASLPSHHTAIHRLARAERRRRRGLSDDRRAA